MFSALSVETASTGKRRRILTAEQGRLSKFVEVVEIDFRKRRFQEPSKVLNLADVTFLYAYPRGVQSNLQAGSSYTCTKIVRRS